MSASVSSSRGGHPSITTPTPPPCDSPHVVMRKRCPNEFAMQAVCGKIGRWSNHPACDERGRRGAIQFIRGGLLVQTTALTPTLRGATVPPRQRENRSPLRGGCNALGRARGSA